MFGFLIPWIEFSRTELMFCFIKQSLCLLFIWKTWEFFGKEKYVHWWKYEIIIWLGDFSVVTTFSIGTLLLVAIVARFNQINWSRGKYTVYQSKIVGIYNEFRIKQTQNLNGFHPEKKKKKNCIHVFNILCMFLGRNL